ncbi:RidA family protein [Paenibacillus darwinianus]|nr:RidA family protein [Paenibacillus darwinianus]
MGSRYWELEHLRTGTIVGLLFISGKGPTEEEKGKLGEHFTTEQGYQFARQAGFEVLAAVKEYTGSLDRVRRVVKAQGFVNAVPSFLEHAKVLNGFSDLMIG